MGKIDEDGFIYICGRNKEMIVLPNGKKIFPEEIETLLNKIEGIKESFVYENQENKICAKIVCDNLKMEQSIKEEINKVNDMLPQYKRINNILITTESIERTSIGKIKRSEEKNKILLVEQEKQDENNVFLGNDEKVKNIICKKLGTQIIQDDMNFINDLCADSLDMVEIFLEVEKEFNIKITREERRKVTRVCDLIHLIN